MSPPAPIHRLLTEFRRRGPTGLAHFLARRVVRFQRHWLFQRDLDFFGLTPRNWPGYRFIVVSQERFNVQSSRFSEQFAAVAQQGGGEYLEDIPRGKAVMLLILSGRTPVHYAYVLRGSRTVCLLGEVHEQTALLGNAFTWPAYRGRGLQAYSVFRRAAVAQQLGLERVVSETTPDNTASQHGLLKGGFSKDGEIAVLVLFNRLALGWSSARRRPLYVRWCR